MAMDASISHKYPCIFGVPRGIILYILGECTSNCKIEQYRSPLLSRIIILAFSMGAPIYVFICIYIYISVEEARQLSEY